MTPERLEELRTLAADHRWGCATFVAELLAELDKHRAGVERVKALPTYDLEGASWDGRMIIRDDVLAALEATDD